jgi:hypothetical protein
MVDEKSITLKIPENEYGGRNRDDGTGALKRYSFQALAISRNWRLRSNGLQAVKQPPFLDGSPLAGSISTN